ncbi:MULTISPECIES: hypothetical protein [unclassified Moorena]|uniref:hypothetical protein n=1 Tax=unclassified Moorena TaxID=2683338 RepID=UPI001401941C|nr:MULTISPECIES: hypothetical protein [unclassified Moorena]NEO11437.1 hypothetical protein [Moorena sp. SIO3E8]NEP99274.1 hypothetical protein [Moorena sp. SIO3F7]
MATAVKLIAPGFCVKYPKTPWSVIYVEDASGKFHFRLSSRDFKFEPRDRYRYPTHEAAKRAALCFLELLKRIERSRMRMSILLEIGILKFPQQTYHSYEIWLLIDRTRYSWEAITPNGFCFRSQRWYKSPNTPILKAKKHIDRELAIYQIKDVVGWV